MQPNFLKVEGNDGLVRDMSTRAIINTNSTEYESYLRKKTAHKNQVEESRRNTEDINTIKQEMSEIKELLLLLIQNKG